MSKLSGKKHPNQDEVVVETVEKLNTDIFNSSIEDIKQLMTIAILDTQAFMDNINFDGKVPRYIEQK